MDIGTAAVKIALILGGAFVVVNLVALIVFLIVHFRR